MRCCGCWLVEFGLSNGCFVLHPIPSSDIACSNFRHWQLGCCFERQVVGGVLTRFVVLALGYADVDLCAGRQVLLAGTYLSVCWEFLHLE